MAGGSDNVVVGGKLYSENDIQTRLRKYAQDKKAFQFLVLYEKDTTTILKVISEKFGTVPPEMVTDFRFQYPELNELPYQFKLNANTNSPHTTIVLANDIASSLHRNHHLLIDGLYVAPDGSSTATSRSSTTPLPELLRILDVGLQDSAGAGFTNVLVRRLWPFDAPGASPAQITTAMTLVLHNNTAVEDALPNPAATMNTGTEYNFVETTRESYGVSEHIKSGIETFLADKPLDIALRLCQIRYAKMIERAIVTGARTSKKVGQKIEYETGGVLEFIAQNSANIISFPKIIQPKNFTYLVKDLFDNSGVEELWLFGGTDYVTALANAYEGKMYYTRDEAMSIKYDVKVDSLEAVGRPGKLYIVGAPILNQIGMSKEAIVLNLEDKYRCFQIAEKEPLSDRPEGEETLSPKGQYSQYRELYSMWGLVRRLAKTHYWIIDTSISY